MTQPGAVTRRCVPAQCVPENCVWDFPSQVFSVPPNNVYCAGILDQSMGVRNRERQLGSYPGGGVGKGNRRFAGIGRVRTKEAAEGWAFGILDACVRLGERSLGFLG